MVGEGDGDAWGGEWWCEEVEKRSTWLEREEPHQSWPYSYFSAREGSGLSKAGPGGGGREGHGWTRPTINDKEQLKFARGGKPTQPPHAYEQQ